MTKGATLTGLRKLCIPVNFKLLISLGSYWGPPSWYYLIRHQWQPQQVKRGNRGVLSPVLASGRKASYSGSEGGGHSLMSLHGQQERSSNRPQQTWSLRASQVHKGTGSMRSKQVMTLHALELLACYIWVRWMQLSPSSCRRGTRGSENWPASGHTHTAVEPGCKGVSVWFQDQAFHFSAMALMFNPPQSCHPHFTDEERVPSLNHSEPQERQSRLCKPLSNPNDFLVWSLQPF